MSKETRHGHQPTLSTLGCVALLDAVRAGSPKSRVKLRTTRAASA